jgi:hypothetical protein
MSQTELIFFGHYCIKYVGKTYIPKVQNVASAVGSDTDESSSTSSRTRKTKRSRSPESVLSSTDSTSIIDIVVVKRKIDGKEMAMIFEFITNNRFKFDILLDLDKFQNLINKFKKNNKFWGLPNLGELVNNKNFNETELFDKIISSLVSTLSNKL